MEELLNKLTHLSSTSSIVRNRERELINDRWGNKS